MPALTCQLTYRDTWGAAGAWTRVFVASVGLMPILLKVRTSLFEQIRRDRQPPGGLEGHLAVARFAHHLGTPGGGAWTQTQANVVPEPRSTDEVIWPIAGIAGYHHPVPLPDTAAASRTGTWGSRKTQARPLRPAGNRLPTGPM